MWLASYIEMVDLSSLGSHLPRCEHVDHRHERDDRRLWPFGETVESRFEPIASAPVVSEHRFSIIDSTVLGSWSERPRN